MLLLPLHLKWRVNTKQANLIDKQIEQTGGRKRNMRKRDKQGMKHREETAK